jgi:hypothetical protein
LRVERPHQTLEALLTNAAVDLLFCQIHNAEV